MFENKILCFNCTFYAWVILFNPAALEIYLCKTLQIYNFKTRLVC